MNRRRKGVCLGLLVLLVSAMGGCFWITWEESVQVEPQGAALELSWSGIARRGISTVCGGGNVGTAGAVWTCTASGPDTWTVQSVSRRWSGERLGPKQSTAWSGTLRLLSPTEALLDLKDVNGQGFDGNGRYTVRASGGRLYANR